MKKPPASRLTDRQIAFLTYHGYGSKIENMTSADASNLIESIFESDTDHNVPDEGRSLGYTLERQGHWPIDRMRLHPELYKAELISDLSIEMATYVRGKFTGSSERITEGKISEVVGIILDEDVRWWVDKNRKILFLQRFSEHYPKCCDGKKTSSTKYNSKQDHTIAPTTTNKTKKSIPYKNKKSRRLFFVLLIVAIIVWIKKSGDSAHMGNQINKEQSNEAESSKHAEAKESLEKMLAQIKLNEELKKQAQTSPPAVKIPEQISIPEPQGMASLEKLELPFSVVTIEPFSLLNKIAKETPISTGTVIKITNRSKTGTLTAEINGELFVGNEDRLLGKIKSQ